LRCGWVGRSLPSAREAEATTILRAGAPESGTCAKTSSRFPAHQCRPFRPRARRSRRWARGPIAARTLSRWGAVHAPAEDRVGDLQPVLELVPRRMAAEPTQRAWRPARTAWPPALWRHRAGRDPRRSRSPVPRSACMYCMTSRVCPGRSSSSTVGARRPRSGRWRQEAIRPATGTPRSSLTTTTDPCTPVIAIALPPQGRKARTGRARRDPPTRLSGTRQRTLRRSHMYAGNGRWNADLGPVLFTDCELPPSDSHPERPQSNHVVSHHHRSRARDCPPRDSAFPAGAARAVNGARTIGGEQRPDQRGRRAARRLPPPV
jgi:hypothetical protein